MSDRYKEVTWQMSREELEALRGIAERQGLPMDHIDWHGPGWQRARNVWFRQTSDLLPFTPKGMRALAKLTAAFEPNTIENVCWDLTWSYMQFVASVCAEGTAIDPKDMFMTLDPV